MDRLDASHDETTGRLTRLAASRQFGVSLSTLYDLCRRVPGLAVKVDGARGCARWRYLIDPQMLAEVLASRPDLNQASPPRPPAGRPPRLQAVAHVGR